MQRKKCTIWCSFVLIIWRTDTFLNICSLHKAVVRLKSEQGYVGFFLMFITLLLCVSKAYAAWCRTVDQFRQWADHPAAGFHTSSRKRRYSRLGSKVRRVGFRIENSNLISAWYAAVNAHSCLCDTRLCSPMSHFRIKNLMNETPTSYSLLIMHKDIIYAVRDPYGNRPLCIGRLIPVGDMNGKGKPHTYSYTYIYVYI